jgi:hypothetical protein
MITVEDGSFVAAFTSYSASAEPVVAAAPAPAAAAPVAAAPAVAVTETPGKHDYCCDDDDYDSVYHTNSHSPAHTQLTSSCSCRNCSTRLLCCSSLAICSRICLCRSTRCTSIVAVDDVDVDFFRPGFFIVPE